MSGQEGSGGTATTQTQDRRDTERAEQAERAGRDKRGRFAPGNPGGPGRPSKAREAAYLAVIREVATLDDFAKVVVTALLNAQKGDGQARDWLSSYLIGKPAQAIDIRHEEGGGSLEEQFAHLSDAELEEIVASANSTRSGAGAGDTT